MPPQPHPPPVAMAGRVIALRDLWKAYDGTPALRGLSLEAYAGEILGLIGPNGAGKTTTLKILVGLLRPDRGSVEVLGRDILADPVTYKAALGYMPEDPSLPEYLTPLEFLRYVGRVRGLPRDRLLPRARELLEAFDLGPKAGTMIATLSKGMKAKLAFAAALVHRPRLLILDEPLIGIDPAGQHRVKGELQALAAAGGTVLVSTHQLDTAERLCNRVAILYGGRNLAAGDLGALRAQTRAGEVGGLEEIFLKLTEEAAAPPTEPPRPRWWRRP